MGPALVAVPPVTTWASAAVALIEAPPIDDACEGGTGPKRGSDDGNRVNVGRGGEVPCGGPSGSSLQYVFSEGPTPVLVTVRGSALVLVD